MSRADSFPNDIEHLKQLLSAAQDQVQRLSTQLHSRDILIEKMKLQLAQLRRLKFGRSSEQLDAQIAQLELSLEELEANAAEAPIAAQPTATASASIKPTRQALPADLPRESHQHEPSTGTCSCPQCGGALRAMGEDVSEMLEYVPEHWKVHRHVRPKYSCSSCESIVQANAPSRPIERGYAGPGLLAHVVVSKYCYHQPLYRQSQIYARSGIDLDRSTLAEWVGSLNSLIAPLTDALANYVMRADKLHADDTPIPVLAPGTGKTKTGRLWTYVRDDQPAGSTDPPAVLFRYSPDRKGERPRAHLQDFRGILQADGYAGFQGLYDRADEPLLEAACWAHARRKFFEIHAATNSPAALEALERIGALYKIEADIRGQSPEQRKAVRQAHAAPRLAQLHAWLQATVRPLSRKSPLAGAIGYALSRWQALTRYRDDGRLEIGRVEMWRGGGRTLSTVPAPFVWRCLNRESMAPFPHPARRTGHADLPHPALTHESQAFAFATAARDSGKRYRPSISYRYLSGYWRYPVPRLPRFRISHRRRRLSVYCWITR